MQHKLRPIMDRFIGGLYHPATEQERQRWLLEALLLFALGVSLVSLPRAHGPDTLYARAYYLFIALLVVSLIFAFRNQLWPGRVVFPLGAFAFITNLVYSGGVHDDALGGYYLLLVFVALLLGQAALLAYGFMSTIAIVIVGTAEVQGRITTHFGPLTEPMTVATTALLMLGTTLALHFLMVRLNREAHNARENEQAQTTANRELMELKVDLERRVAQRTSELDLANQQLQFQLRQIMALQTKLREEAIRDPLTTLFNRRYMEESLPREVARAARNGRPLAIIMLDIDHFKDLNDQCGHACGDSLLRVLGPMLRTHFRAGDIACRYGGEEFAIILPEATLAVATRRAEEIRVAAKHLRADGPGATQRFITLSLGVACIPEHGSTGEAVIAAADAALYQAKRNGRDQVMVAATTETNGVMFEP